MTGKERLIELIDKTFYEQHYQRRLLNAEITADYLLDNGVIVPPCKAGDTVWVILQNYKFTKPEIESRKILSVQIYKNRNIQYHYKDGCFYKNVIGKTVFFTREEAEKALAERSFSGV